MKNFVASALAALALTLLAACGGASPVGIYDVDKAAFKEVMLASMDAEARSSKEAMAAVDKIVDGMSTTIELAADGTAKMDMKMSVMGRPMDNSATGTWKLDGTKLTVAMKEGTDVDTKTAEFDGKSFTIEDDTGGQKMKMTFRRR